MTRPRLATCLRTLSYLQLAGEVRRRVLRFGRPARRAESTPRLRVAQASRLAIAEWRIVAA